MVVGAGLSRTPGSVERSEEAAGRQSWQGVWDSGFVVQIRPRPRTSGSGVRLFRAEGLRARRPRGRRGR